MPTRADLDAARPRCDAPVVEGGPVLMDLNQLAAATVTCDRPLKLRTFSGELVWVCEQQHGTRMLAADLVAGQQGQRTQLP